MKSFQGKDILCIKKRISISVHGSFPSVDTFLENAAVFKIEVLMNGRKHFVEKRYSEFHALHKKLKKCIKTPEIPSKHVRNWVPKVLEQRRQGLETKLSHQPVLLFLGDPYVLPAASDFPNVVIEGVLHGIFYSHLQPR
ncbi:Snx24 [Phodopus roborovskii]|uniref:Snx24 protein n=1 Tax=Phodopus roborovskii TaxID=109678 RepID=A0AAU9ZZH8_PHORO|nr:Snx24 [Phodopus roborovskii]